MIHAILTYFTFTLMLYFLIALDILIVVAFQYLNRGLNNPSESRRHPWRTR